MPWFRRGVIPLWTVVLAVGLYGIAVVMDLAASDVVQDGVLIGPAILSFMVFRYFWDLRVRLRYDALRLSGLPGELYTAGVNPITTYTAFLLPHEDHSDYVFLVVQFLIVFALIPYDERLALLVAGFFVAVFAMRRMYFSHHMNKRLYVPQHDIDWLTRGGNFFDRTIRFRLTDLIILAALLILFRDSMDSTTLTVASLLTTVVILPVFLVSRRVWGVFVEMKERDLRIRLVANWLGPEAVVMPERNKKEPVV